MQLKVRSFISETCKISSSLFMVTGLKKRSSVCIPLQNNILCAVMLDKSFLQHLWRRFYDALEQPDPKHSIDIIHHLQRERERTHTLLLRKDEKSKADDVKDLSTKLSSTVVTIYIYHTDTISSLELCGCLCVFLYLPHSEYQKYLFY